MPSPSPIVSCRDASVLFGDVLALCPTSLTVEPGESVALMGPSGSGKTTLLQCIEGLIRPTSGAVQVLGQDQRAASRGRRADLRRRQMGLVFQSPDLLPEFSTVENVAFPLVFDGVPRARALGLAVQALDAVGIADRAHASVHTLSGGEAQRASIARALARPDVALVIADEPTASLDAESAEHVTRLLLDLAGAREAGVLLATHDPVVAAQCDRVQRLARHSAAA